MPELMNIETHSIDRPMPPLSVEFRLDSDNSCTLTWIGSVESKNHHLMWFFSSSEVLLQHLLTTGVDKLIIDLSRANRVDSDGLRRLFNARQEFIQNQVQIVLRRPTPHLGRLLRIMQFDQIFEIET